MREQQKKGGKEGSPLNSDKKDGLKYIEIQDNEDKV